MIEEIKGKVLKSVKGLEEGSDLIVFDTQCGKRYSMYHDQDCCEHVSVCDFDNTIDEFEGALVLSAEEVTSDASDSCSESGTWTFYKIETNKGGIWIRWLGESNGYYSEGVSFREEKVA